MKKPILILLFLSTISFAQLEIYERDTNYLTYNNQPIVLIGAVPLNTNFHILDFDIAFIDSMKAWGANHLWIMLENYFERPWIEVKNTETEQLRYWNKLHEIAETCYNNDIIMGISIYGYGLISDKARCYYSFNNCCGCKGDRGPLTEPWEFYRFTNSEVNEAQYKIIEMVLKATWEYENVYYQPCWESAAIWNDDGNTMFNWTKKINNFIRNYGSDLNSNMNHLIAIEKTVSINEAKELGVDFVIDEDGNAYKTEGIPFIYWSMDGIYRGTPCWNSDYEPKYNLEWTAQEFYSGSASISTIWGTNEEEKKEIKRLASDIKNHYLYSISSENIINYSDETGFEISNLTRGYKVKKDSGHIQYYIDRDYIVSADGIFIQTKNNDKNIVNEKFLYFEINRKSIMHLFFDIRNELPVWFNDFNKTDTFIMDSDGILFDEYIKEFDAGEIVLGSNTDDVNSGSMYFLKIEPEVNDIKLNNPVIIKVE